MTAKKIILIMTKEDEEFEIQRKNSTERKKKQKDN